MRSEHRLKKWRRGGWLAVALAGTLLLAGCESQEEEVGQSTSETVTVGFSQIGAESDWRLASTESMRNAFNVSTGYTLMMDDGQQKQENQLKAMRRFIDSGVDYIVLDPITETGWDATLAEAAEADIPVLIVDRRVAVEDDDVYAAWAGSDFRLEGDRACAWLAAYLEGGGDAAGDDVAGEDGEDAVGDATTGEDGEDAAGDAATGEDAAHPRFEGEINIAHIQGTLGSSAQIGRSEALFDAAQRYGWNILESTDADFVQAKGKEVMETMLSEYGDTINVVYCENDSEALGAIEALKNHGMVPGADIAAGEVLIVSFDATNDGLEKTLAGEIVVNTECNPNYGVLAVKLIHSLESGIAIDHDNYQEEAQFSVIPGITEVNVGDDTYPVTYLTQQIIDGRSY